MKITIIGAGPIGLMMACLLSSHHQITVFEKREEYSRNHLLNIDGITIDALNQFLILHPLKEIFNPILESWRNSPISTDIMQNQLMEIAINAGVTIRYENIKNLDSISDSIVIAADGARSTIRQLIFGTRIEDMRTIAYMAQFKYITSGRTKPRSSIVGMGHNFFKWIHG